MATVTGKESTKIDELLGQTVVGGELDSDGTLVLSRKNGQTINAGSLGGAVVSAVVNASKRLIFTRKDGTTVDAGSIEVTKPIDSWPVGSIYMTASSANPNSILGGGTWVKWGAGRVPVGVDATQSEFDALEETGGVKSVTLTESQLPSHTHTMSHTHPMPHRHEPFTATDRFMVNTPGEDGNRGGGSSWHAKSIASTGDPSKPDTSEASVTTTGPSPGGGQAHTNLQPYITCHMWKRTA